MPKNQVRHLAPSCEVVWPGGVKTSHSDDLVRVECGSPEPYVFCGFHARYYLVEAIRVARENRLRRVSK